MKVNCPLCEDGYLISINQEDDLMVVLSCTECSALLFEFVEDQDIEYLKAILNRPR